MAGNIKGITVELGADTSKLSDALSKADKSLKTTQNELSQVNKSLKFDPGNSDLLKDKQTLLAQQISETKDKLEALKKAQANMDANGVDKNSEEYQKLQVQIDTTKSKLSGLNDEMDDFGSAGAQKIAYVGKKIQEVGDKISSVGSGMSKCLTAPIVAAAGASAAAWKEVDDAMDTVVTKTGATGDALTSLQDSVSNVATSIPTSFEDAGTAIGEVNTRFGSTGKELEGLSSEFIKFANINGTDLNTSIDSTNRILKQFGLSTSDANGLLGVLSATSQKTGYDTTSLMNDLEQNGAAFRDMGLSAGSAVTLLGNFEAAGIDSQTAMKGISKAAVAWQQDGKSVSDGLSDLVKKLQDGNVSTQDYADVVDLMGTKAADKFVDMAKSGRLSLDGLNTSLDSYGTTVSDTFEGTLDPADQLTVTMNQLKETGSTLFTTMQTMALPLMQKLNTFLQNLNTKFKSMSPAQQEMIVKIGLVVAAIGPVLIVVGKVIKLCGTFMTLAPALGAAITVATGPIGLIVLAIAACVAAGVLLYKNWDKIKAAASALGNKIKEEWGKLKQNTKQAFTNMKTSVSTAWDGMKTKIANSALGKTAGIVWNAVKTTTQTNLSAIKASYDTHGGGMKGAVAATMTAIKQHYTTGYTFLNTLTKGKLGTMLATSKEKMSDMSSDMKTKLGHIKDNFKDKFGTAQSTVDTKMSSILSTAKEKMNSMKDTIKNGLDAIGNFFANLHWELPKIKLPHFSISGSFSLDPPSMPSFGVDWYDKGGVFSSPTVIGVGEKRPEFVGALDDLRQIVREEAGAGSSAILSQMLVLMQQIAKKDPVTVNQTINADDTSYIGQQKQAARQFKEIARMMT